MPPLHAPARQCPGRPPCFQPLSNSFPIEHVLKLPTAEHAPQCCTHKWVRFRARNGSRAYAVLPSDSLAACLAAPKATQSGMAQSH